MSGDILLDTNIIIALFAKEAVVEAALSGDRKVFVASTVLGELYYGANKSGRAAFNLARIDEFCGASAVLCADALTAKHYGRIKNDLRIKGHPLPENDIWIAAIAAQYGLTLISRDAHFREIAGLEVESW